MYFMKCIFLFIVFSFITISSDAQPANVTLNKNLVSIQAKSNWPGFGIAIIKNDSIVFSNGYGFANTKNNIPYSVETIQPIGSISKTFIGFAIMKAIEQGYFTLETPINDILPFKIINPYYPNAVIKIKHLVTHTSGLIDKEDTYMAAYNEGKKPSMDLKDFLKEYYVNTGKFYSKENFYNSEPNKVYNYSNIAAALAAYLVEIKANMSFADYTAKYIFGPLKMNDTHWFYNEAKSNKYATLYEVNKLDEQIFKTIVNADRSVKTYSCTTYPDGSLKTSVADLSKYLMGMVKGYANNSTLLQKESFETLFKKQFSDVDMPLNMDTKEPNRAIFWAYNKKGKIMHTGSDIGVSAFISFEPDTKIGRVILINADLQGEENGTAVENFKKIIGEIENFEKGLK
jgi:CubicO group peptidase (beta-lactamase class C family)